MFCYWFFVISAEGTGGGERGNMIINKDSSLIRVRCFTMSVHNISLLLLFFAAISIVLAESDKPNARDILPDVIEALKKI